MLDFLRRTNGYRSLILPAIVCALVFSYVCLSNSYYLPSKLNIGGQTDQRIEALIAWDSGQGFNQNEQVPVVLGSQQPLLPSTHQVEIRKVAFTNSLAKSNEVRIRSILIDGKKLSWDQIELSPGTLVRADGLLALLRPDSFVRLEADFSELQVDLHMSASSGKTEFRVDGEARIVDLYSPYLKTDSLFWRRFSPGPFSISIPLPQRHLTGLKIVTLDPEHRFHLSSLTIECSKGTAELEVDSSTLISEAVFTDLQPGTEKFHPLLLIIHLFLAFLAGWGVFELQAWLKRANKTTLYSALRFAFLEEARWLYWLLFLTSSSVFLLWLLGHWPGAMTIDSINSWNQTKTLGISNWHPWTYTVFMLGLTQLLDSPAVVGIFQILTLAGLASFVCTFLIREKTPGLLVLPFFALFVLSVPIGLYNITLWKDVPFSTLSFFWAFLLYYLFYRKKTGSPVVPGLKVVLLLAALLLGLATIRHNGVLYLVVIPVILLWLQLIPRDRVAALVLLSVGSYLLFQFVVADWTGIHRRTDYQYLNLSWKLNPLAALFLAPSYYYETDNYQRDQEIMERWVSLEDIKRRYTPYRVDPLAGARRILTPQEAAEINRLYLKRIPANLPIFVGDRGPLFASTFCPKNPPYGNLLVHHRLVDTAYMTPSLHYLSFAPRWEWLHSAQIAIFNFTRFSLATRLLFWNSLPAFLLLLTVLCLYRFFPISAVSAAMLLLQFPVLFITMPVNDWRYYYFIYPYSFFAIPLVVLEFRRTRLMKQSSHSQGSTLTG